MLVALAFRRPDVDEFLNELTHEQYLEWTALLHLHPQGWAATNIAIARLSYIIAQVHCEKSLREGDFILRLASTEGASEAQQRILMEANAIRSAIAAGTYQHGQDD